MKTPAAARLSLIAFLSHGACAHRVGPDPSIDLSAPTVGVGVEGPAGALLAQLAADVDPSIRAAAVAVLVRASAEPGGGQVATAATWDPDPWVQRAAVRALEARRDEPESLAHLSELASRAGIDPYVRCRAAVLLPQPVAPEVVEAVHSSWAHAPLWKAAPCAAAEASWGDVAAKKRLEEALSEGALALEPLMVRTLSTAELPGIEPSMVQGLEVADELVRPALIRALLQRGHGAARDALRDGLSHEDPLVRMEAIELLAEVEHADTNALLARAAQSQDMPEGRVAALVLAARTGAPFRVFEEAFAGENRDVRRAAVKFGAEHVARQEAQGGGRSARKRLEKILAEALVDMDPTTREVALQHTGALQVVSLRSVVDALVADTTVETTVRIHAAETAIALAAAAR